jgi:hypothetical protein
MGQSRQNFIATDKIQCLSSAVHFGSQLVNYGAYPCQNG